MNVYICSPYIKEDATSSLFISPFFYLEFHEVRPDARRLLPHGRRFGVGRFKSACVARQSPRITASCSTFASESPSCCCSCPFALLLLLLVVLLRGEAAPLPRRRGSRDAGDLAVEGDRRVCHCHCVERH